MSRRKRSAITSTTILPDLPKGPIRRSVSKIDPDASPILYVTLTSPGTLRDITEIADKMVRRQIESINGVKAVNILGGKKRQINVWLDPLKLEAAGLTAIDVERALASQNLSVPGGQIETGPKSLSLRVEGRWSTTWPRSHASSSRRRRTTPRASATWRASTTASKSRERRPPRTARRASCSIRKQSGGEHRRRGRRHQGAARRGSEGAPHGVRAQDRARRVERHPHERRRGERAPHRRSAARSSRRLLLPGKPPEHPHRRSGDPDEHHRNVRGDVVGRIHAQHDHAPRPGAGRRHRHRRRDRRAREHLPAHRGQEREADARRGGGHEGDWPRGHGDDALAHRGVPTGRVHEGHPGALSPVVRGNDGLFHRHLDARELLLDSDDVVAVAQRKVRVGKVVRRASGRRLLQADRAGLRRRSALRHAPSMDRRRRGGVDSGVMRTLGRKDEQGLLAGERRGSLSASGSSARGNWARRDVPHLQSALPVKCAPSRRCV